MAPRISLSNYKHLFLFLALAIASPAYGQEGGFFALLDEDRRRELTIEFGLSFMEDPVFRGFVDGGERPHPATKVSLKTPRHISGTFGWRLNDWLRVEASMNFNSADFGGASSGGGPLEDQLNQLFIGTLRGSRANVVDAIVLRLLEDQDFAAAAMDEDENLYRSGIMARDEYSAAMMADDECDEACARMAAEEALAECAGDIARGEFDNIDGIQFTLSAPTFEADGTFFSIGSFLSAYADIPITRNFWLYGGGGMGVAWSHVKDGFYTISVPIDVDETDLSRLQQDIENELGIAALGIDNLDEVGTGLMDITRIGDQRTSIVSTVTSFAMTASVGMRTALFEGLVFDSGYQIIWTPQGFYRGADEEIAHLLRVGFVFNF